MNILYITQWFSSVGGGGEVVLHDIALGISQKGHCVHVISHLLPDAKENNKTDYNKGSVHIHRIKPIIKSYPQTIGQNIMFIINAIIKGSQIIRKFKIDLIHVNNFAPVIVGSVLSKLFHIPIISTIHVVFGTSVPGFWKNWSTQNNISSLSSFIGPMFENLTIKIPVNTIHSVSNVTRKDILKVNSKSKVVVIPNSINLALYDMYASGIDYQNYVVFIGRLVFNKNLETVISSFREVIRNIPDAKLVVVGFGPMLVKWKSLVDKLGLTQNIQFTEYICEEKKIAILGKASALVLPSITEGMPVVALEAFALYKPVLLSDIEPHRDIVNEGVDGFLIPAHDVSKWSEKIINILLNKKVCQDMGQNARAKVENQFSMSKTLKQMESLYSANLAARS